MAAIRAIRTAFSAAILSIAAAGCSSGSGGQAVTESQMLLDLKFCLEEYGSRTNGAAPRSINDLAPLEPSFPGALRSLNTKACVYIWGNGFDGRDVIIGYEKDAPTNGGACLYANKTIKNLSAAEFAAAPKAQ